jgi:hypothetical protein
LGNKSSAHTKSIGWRIVSTTRLLAIQLLVFFVLLEIVSRIVDPIGISYYDESARLFDEMIIEEPIGYRFPPGLEGNFYSVPVSINAHGMRDRPVPAQKDPGEFRILAMGDSVIFSLGVAAEDSIPAQLEAIANENTPKGVRYRTLNMGVPSYNTVQQLEQLRQVGLSLKPDAAFLFLVPNDLQDKMWVYEKRGNFLVDMAQRSYAVGITFYAGRWFLNMLGFYTNPNQVRFDHEQFLESHPELAAESGSEIPGSSGSRPATRKDVLDAVLSEQRWLDVENSLLEMSRLLREVNVPFMVLYRSHLRQSYVRRIAELGKQAGFAVQELDIFDDPRWDKADKAKYVNSPVDSHCNAAGCTIYATVIYEKLVETGLLPGAAVQ